VLALALSGAALGPAAAAAEDVMCEGQKASIIAVSGEATYGTPGNDVIYGERDVYIDGAGGDDVICLIDGTAIGEAGYDTIRVTGTSEPESLVLSGEDFRVVTGGGGDQVRVLESFGGAGRFNLGKTGENTILFGTARTVDVNLRKRTVTLNGAAYSLRGELASVVAASRTVTMSGTKRDDVLSVMQGSCRATLKGGKGKDLLQVVPRANGDAPTSCENPGVHAFYGQKGDDTLIGGKRRDRLYGGPGSDSADGGIGVDICEAETLSNCER
jgi:Ca2+-binding RTX toxin-like protein